VGQHLQPADPVLRLQFSECFFFGGGGDIHDRIVIIFMIDAGWFHLSKTHAMGILQIHIICQISLYSKEGGVWSDINAKIIGSVLLRYS
jgi:hypothetical protein